jgi:hypothetical protein
MSNEVKVVDTFYSNGVLIVDVTNSTEFKDGQKVSIMDGETKTTEFTLSHVNYQSIFTRDFRSTEVPKIYKGSTVAIEVPVPAETLAQVN